MDKIISDFKTLLEEREEKLKNLFQQGLSTKREEDEIQEDFNSDSRRIKYHDLRRSLKGKIALQKKFMEIQNQIFNQQ
ncbi:MAG: hypothetical protein HXX16_20125 [Bacteroidales bacterium]|nr:hypothetical protein [Bacteroidales bacterium]